MVPFHISLLLRNSKSFIQTWRVLIAYSILLERNFTLSCGKGFLLFIRRVKCNVCKRYLHTIVSTIVFTYHLIRF